MILTIIGLVVVFGGIFGWYALKQQFINHFFSTFTPPPQTVSTVVAANVTWQPYLVAVGSIGATNGVDISPEVPGQIKSIFFTSGQFVKKDAPLVQLDDSSEKAQLADVHAQLDLAKTNLSRTKNLYAQQATTKSALDDANAKVKQLQANFDNISSSISKKLIRAPFDGKIGISLIDLGQFINAGQICTSLQAVNAYNVKFFLPQQDFKNITLKQAVKISSDAYPNEVFDGYVTAVDSKIDENTRTIKVEAIVNNSSGKLIPGLFVNVKLILPDEPNTTTVPQTAVASTLYGDSAFIVTLNGKKDEKNLELGTVKRVFVHTGDKQENTVVILEGIKPGDIVVNSGQLKLDDGTAIVVNNSIPL